MPKMHTGQPQPNVGRLNPAQRHRYHLEALQDAIDSMTSFIDSYRQTGGYEKYDWMRMHEWVNKRAAFRQILAKLRREKL